MLYANRFIKVRKFNLAAFIMAFGFLIVIIFPIFPKTFKDYVLLLGSLLTFCLILLIPYRKNKR